MVADAKNKKAKLKDWFLRDALPFWARAGVDFKSGGFFEKLGDDGVPIEEPRRARLVARQIYVFATGAELGWTGPANELVNHGLDFLRAMIREDDTVIPTVNADGTPVRGDFDLYDCVFVLFGLAAACRRLGGDETLRALADRIRLRMISGWAHPRGGFEESIPSSLPLKSNPHMHLLEACLAWEEVAPGDGNAWRSLADEVVDLCRTRFIDSRTGALREYFDHDWGAFPGDFGRIVEPGHQFEWCWLLLRWAARRDRSDVGPVALRLLEVGESFGVDSIRGVAVNELDDRLIVRNPHARLWPQTERIKAWHSAARLAATQAERERAEACLDHAIDGLLCYFEDRPKGLWRDTMFSDRSFDAEPTRASSLYHIACAIEALDDRIG